MRAGHHEVSLVGAEKLLPHRAAVHGWRGGLNAKWARKRFGPVLCKLQRASLIPSLGGKASDKAQPLPDTPEATEKKASRIRQAATVDEAERYLSEVEELRNFAKENAETLWQQGLADDSRKWLTVHQAIAKQYPSLHAQVLKLREAHKITITTQAAQSTFTAFLARVRGLIDSMPGALAAKVNPSDPDHAREQLERWRDESLYKTLSTAPSVLP